MSTAAPNTTPASVAPTPRGEASTEPDEASAGPDQAWAGPHHRLDPAEDRGRTTIADRVVEAMAVRITSDEPGVGGAARRIMGFAVTGEDADQAPRVQATVTGEVISLRVRLSVTYPTPVHLVTDRLRRRLIERIGQLTGKRVGVVEIVVAALHRPDTSARVIR